MNKLLSCRYNMDTNRVEARTNTATPRHSGQNWTGCSTISLWSMHRWCWVGRLSIISRLVATMEEWKID